MWVKLAPNLGVTYEYPPELHSILSPDFLKVVHGQDRNENSITLIQTSR